jgi:hypothetical protein
MRRNIAWITWESHRRTRELARALDADLTVLTFDGPRLLRYPLLLIRTTWWLIRRRPDVLVVQCPSIVLGVYAGLLKPVFRYVLVADLHNEAVHSSIHRSSAYGRLLALLRRFADLSIVTNPTLKRFVDRTGGRAFVLPDKIPVIERRVQSESSRPASVVFICSFAADEPYLQVIEAARLLEPSVTVHVTGDHCRLSNVVVSQLPSNVRLMGYLPHADYDQLLLDADVIMDLTCRESCLVCGAYEAVAAEKPLVTSATRALRAYFRLGTVHTKHEPSALAAAMMQAIHEKERLTAEMKLLKTELHARWERRLGELRALLETGDRPGGRKRPRHTRFSARPTVLPVRRRRVA